MRELENVYIDIASLEWVDTLKSLEERGYADRALFSTHTPFYFPEANINKLVYTDAERETVRRVAYINAERILAGRQD